VNLAAKNLLLDVLPKVSNAIHLFYKCCHLIQQKKFSRVNTQSDFWSCGTPRTQNLQEHSLPQYFISSGSLKIKRNVPAHKNLEVHKNEDHLLQKKEV
jgi:hypothetical protein